MKMEKEEHISTWYAYDLWVVGGYSRESLRRAGALGDGVSASQWTVAAMDLATPGRSTKSVDMRNSTRHRPGLAGSTACI